MLQMERGAAATAPKLMLLSAKIAKLQHDASSGDGMDSSSNDAQQKLAKLLEERSVMHRQHQHNLEQVCLLYECTCMPICVSCVHI